MCAGVALAVAEVVSQDVAVLNCLVIPVLIVRWLCVSYCIYTDDIDKPAPLMVSPEPLMVIVLCGAAAILL